MLAQGIARQWETDLATADGSKPSDRKPELDYSAYRRARGKRGNPFRPSRKWLATVGLAELPVDAGRRFNVMIYKRLEQMVGERLAANCPDGLFAEFDHFVHRRR